MISIRKLNKENVAVFCLMMVTFVTAVRVSDELIRLPTFALLLFAFLIINFNTASILSSTFFIAAALIHYILIHVFNYNKIAFENTFPYFILYTLQTLIYSLCFWTIKYDMHIELVLNFFKIYIVISIALWIFSIVTSINIGVEATYLIPRAQGLVTEPSNLAHFLPALILYFWRKSNIRWIVAALTLAVLSFSPTVFLTVAICALLITTLAEPTRIIFITLLMACAYLIIDANWAYLESILISLGQFGQLILRIYEGIQFVTGGGQVGANSRAALIFAGADFMNDHNLWWIGTGFGTSGPIGDVYNEGLLFDANNWASFILWFGLPSLIILIPLHAIVFLNIRLRFKLQKLNFIDYLLLTLVVSNTINGGGVWVQQFFFCLLLTRIFERRLMSKNVIKVKE